MKKMLTCGLALLLSAGSTIACGSADDPGSQPDQGGDPATTGDDGQPASSTGEAVIAGCHPIGVECGIDTNTNWCRWYGYKRVASSTLCKRNPNGVLEHTVCCQ